MSDDNDWGSFHDMVAEVVYPQQMKFSRDALVNIHSYLPEVIRAEGDVWGLGDTVVRDMAYVWLKEQINSGWCTITEHGIERKPADPIEGPVRRMQSKKVRWLVQRGGQVVRNVTEVTMPDGTTASVDSYGRVTWS